MVSERAVDSTDGDTSRPALVWAMRAIRKEVFDFRFDYPIEIVERAGSHESLQYFIYSPTLFFDAMIVGDDGVPVQRSRLVRGIHNPAYVAWFGLMELQRALRGESSNGHDSFLRQVNWLATNAQRDAHEAAVWHYGFDWVEGRSVLKRPWISAMSQGLAISALVRGFRMTGDPALLALATDAAGVFERPLELGGVRTVENGVVAYEEYPAYPLPRVLDGFLFSLLGLYDLAVETRDLHHRELWEDGVRGLESLLPFWDFHGRWSMYGSHGYLCPPHYNRLNAALLRTVGRLADRRRLREVAHKWDRERRRPGERAAIYLAFLFTKNRSRVTHALRGLRARSTNDLA